MNIRKVLLLSPALAFFAGVAGSSCSKKDDGASAAYLAALQAATAAGTNTVTGTDTTVAKTTVTETKQVTETKTSSP